MEKDQRLAAILVTDIVGYTALMGRNEAEAMALLEENRRIHTSQIRKYKGVYVKEMGDGTLAHFSSAYEAVLCAIAIQDAIRTNTHARLRMGIHLGEILFENNDTFGEGVNIASRIEPLADPGGICISEAVENALHSYPDITTRFLGKARLKNVADPVPIYGVMGEHLSVPTRRIFAERANPRKKIALKPLNIFLYVALPALLIFFLFLVYNKKIKIADAKSSLLSIENVMNESWRDYSSAYHLAKNVQPILPDNPKLLDILHKSSLKVNVTSEPEGARVYIKEYTHPEQEWQLIGTTPLKNVELPITVFRWKLEKDGFDTVEAVASSFRTEMDNISKMTRENMFAPNPLHRVLVRKGSVPPDMVRVPGGQMSYGRIRDFFIDKYEVCNKDYKAFIEQGGYKNPAFWKYDFIKEDGSKLSMEEAMALFTDKTGQAGPATWEAGTYPVDHDKYPVTGICWYEAAAYAAYAGKSLPTTDHWGLARGDQTFIIQMPQVGGYALFAPYSNFSQKGPVETGSLPGTTSFGAYDMAGNVREWCFNKSPMGRALRGGAWNDNTYSFRQPIQAPALDRSEINGFRCVWIPEPDSIPAAAFAPVSNFLPPMPDMPPPVSDETFSHFRSFFGYDKTELNAKILYRHEEARDWVLEKIQYDAAYENEKVTSYLFLPKNAKPPYQTVIYLPGVAVFFQASSDGIENYYEFPVFLDYIVKTGRAVLFPVYTGTFERANAYSGMFSPNRQELRTHKFTEFLTRYYKDFERSIDYLETRNDIDKNKIAIYGMSNGAAFSGPVFAALDKRIKANVFVSGGIAMEGMPEANAANYIARISQPTLMINGKFDSVVGIDNIKEAFRHIGAKEKKLVLFDTDHIPPREGMVKETLDWLNKYLGPTR